MRAPAVVAPKRPDPLTPAARSAVMRAVKGRHNRSTERRLRAALAGSGIRGWRLQGAGLPGTPDFVFAAARLAVFVDGCFWHGCPRCYRRPRSRQGYWDEKVRRNRARDRRVTTQLRRGGWHVLRVWEHTLAGKCGAVCARVRRAAAAGA